MRTILPIDKNKLQFNNQQHPFHLRYTKIMAGFIFFVCLSGYFAFSYYGFMLEDIFSLIHSLPFYMTISPDDVKSSVAVVDTAVKDLETVNNLPAIDDDAVRRQRITIIILLLIGVTWAAGKMKGG